MPLRIEVWGDYACFTRPELKVERVSYDVMTPSAARGILEAIYWHPGMRWIIDKIHVLNPIEFSNVRRNEVKSKLNASNMRTAMTTGVNDQYICTKDDIQQRAAMVLRNVRYIIEAHFIMTDKAAPSDNEGKFIDIAKRRAKKGQCYSQPCFGVREFAANFRIWTEDTIPAIDETRDLGLMVYDLDYSDKQNITPMFFRARLDSGVLNVPAPDSGEVLR